MKRRQAYSEGGSCKETGKVFGLSWILQQPGNQEQYNSISYSLKWWQTRLKDSGVYQVRNQLWIYRKGLYKYSSQYQYH